MAIGGHVIEEGAFQRGGPGQRHLDTHIRGDAEEARPVARIDNHIFVPAQGAELGGGAVFGGELVEHLTAAAVQRIGLGVSAPIKVERFAEIHIAVIADIFRGRPPR